MSSVNLLRPSPGGLVHSIADPLDSAVLGADSLPGMEKGSKDNKENSGPEAPSPLAAGKGRTPRGLTPRRTNIDGSQVRRGKAGAPLFSSPARMAGTGRPPVAARPACGKCTAAANEATRLRGHVAALEKRMHTLQIDLINAQEDSVAYEEACRRAEDNFRDLQNEGKSLHRAFVRKTQTVAALSSELHTREREIHIQSMTIDATRQELADALDMANAIRTRASEQERRHGEKMAELEAQLEAAQQQVSSLQEECDYLRQATASALVQNAYTSAAMRLQEQFQNSPLAGSPAESPASSPATPPPAQPAAADRPALSARITAALDKLAAAVRNEEPVSVGGALRADTSEAPATTAASAATPVAPRMLASDVPAISISQASPVLNPIAYLASPSAQSPLRTAAATMTSPLAAVTAMQHDAAVHPQALGEQMEALSISNELLRDEVASVRHQLAAAAQAHCKATARLEADNSSLRTRIAELEGREMELVPKAAQLEAQLAAQLEANTHLQEDLRREHNHHKAALEQLEAEYRHDDYRSRYARLSQENLQLRQRLERLEGLLPALDGVEEKQAEAVEAVLAASAKLEQRAERYAAAAAAATKARQELRDTRMRLGAAESEATLLRDELAMVGETAARAEEAEQALQQARAELDTRAEEQAALFVEQLTLKTAVSMAEERERVLAEELAGARAGLATATERLEALEAAEQRSRAEAAHWQQQAEEMAVRVDEKTGQYTELCDFFEEERMVRQEVIEDLEQSLEGCHQEMAKLQAAIEEKEAIVARQEEEIEALAEQLQRDVLVQHKAVLLQELEATQADLQHAKAETQRLGSELMQKELQLFETKALLDSTQSKHTELEQYMEAYRERAEQKIAVLRSNLDKAEGEVAALDSQLARLHNIS